MENYRQMWMSLRNDLSMRIREYRQADNIAGLDDYGLTELDAWEGIMQEIEGLERQFEENNKAKEKALEFAKKNGLDIDESYPRSDWWKFRDERDAYKKQRDELINDMSEIKKKAEAFDLISNSYTTEIEQAIKNKELNQCLFLLEQILDDLEVDHEG